jgi:hypothetical protein
MLMTRTPRDYSLTLNFPNVSTKLVVTQESNKVPLATVVMFTVILVLYKFNRPFRQYSQLYFGNGGYVECLLETGELPNLGFSQDFPILWREEPQRKSRLFQAAPFL